MSSNRLKELRLEKNLTLRELSEKVNISYSALSLAENGKRNLTDNDIYVFCKFFNVTSDYLLGLSNFRTYVQVKDQQLNETQVALYNATKSLTDAEKDQILDFINYIRAKNNGGEHH